MLQNLTQYRWVQGWHINASGQLFGGSLLSWTDEDTMMLAHLNSKNVSFFTTGGMENVKFISPGVRGDKLKFEHQIVYFGKTSMWTFSEVFREKQLIFSAYSILVAINDSGKPRLISDYIDVKIIEGLPRGDHYKRVEFLKSLVN